MKKICLLVLFTLLILPKISSAQTENTGGLKVIIVLLDKSEVAGVLIEENDDKIVVQSESLGLMTFSKSQVKKIIRLDIKGRIENPNPTKYFVSQSAFTLSKGEGYYQNIMAVVNLGSYGITDHLSATVGIELISTFQGVPIVFSNLKYGIPISKNWNVALSASYLNVAAIEPGTHVGTFSLLTTFGSKENNFTVGAGYALGSGELTDGPAVTFAGILRVSKKIGVIGESYSLSGETVFGAGVRFYGKKKTIDLLMTRGGFPAVDFVFKF
jgi:hypothetical protein